MKHVIFTLCAALLGFAMLSSSSMAQFGQLPSEAPVRLVVSRWQNLDIGPTSETVITRITARPGGNQIEGVIAFADGPISAVDDAVVIMRFSPSGVIEAFDGDSYRAVTALPYVAG